MQWSDVPFTPSSRMLRQFVGLLIVVFGGLSVWYGFGRDQPTAAGVCAAVAVLVGPLGLVAPQAIRPLFVAWTVAAFPIGWTVSRLLLALVFYGLFTPLALVFTLIGRDRLHRKHRADQPTYWTPKAQPTDLRHYMRQF